MKVCVHTRENYMLMGNGTAKCRICGKVKKLDELNKPISVPIWVVTQTSGAVAAFVSKEAAERWVKENPAGKPLVNCITNVKLELR